LTEEIIPVDADNPAWVGGAPVIQQPHALKMETPGSQKMLELPGTPMKDHGTPMKEPGTPKMAVAIPKMDPMADHEMNVSVHKAVEEPVAEGKQRDLEKDLLDALGPGVLGLDSADKLSIGEGEFGKDT
jgi:hypothetical protein